MDYHEIDYILIRNGLAQEPAFDQVGIAIRPIPDMDGCPLGLYYPDSALIVIPPDGYESVLLHELGHRYGHYYQNNLSEQFAEEYRRHYQKSTALMYSGGDFARMPKFDALFQEGERGVLAVSFSDHLCQDDLMAIRQEFFQCSCGEPIPQIAYSEEQSPTITVHFQKGVDWLSITALFLGAVTIAGIGAISYAIYKVAKDTPWVFPLAIFGTVAGIILIGGVAGKHQMKGAPSRALVRG